MLINRRDLEYILKVMDKFNLSEPWDGVTLDYKETNGGYDLSISFGHVLNDIICNIKVPIVSDILDVE